MQERLKSPCVACRAVSARAVSLLQSGGWKRRLHNGETPEAGEKRPQSNETNAADHLCTDPLTICAGPGRQCRAVYDQDAGHAETAGQAVCVQVRQLPYALLQDYTAQCLPANVAAAAHVQAVSQLGHWDPVGLHSACAAGAYAF